MRDSGFANVFLSFVKRTVFFYITILSRILNMYFKQRFKSPDKKKVVLKKQRKRKTSSPPCNVKLLTLIGAKSRKISDINLYISSGKKVKFLEAI